MKMLSRTRPPWWRFHPHVYRNEEGKQWEIYLADEMSYTVTPIPIQVCLHISQDRSQVTGFTVYDDRLLEALLQSQLPLLIRTGKTQEYEA